MSGFAQKTENGKEAGLALIWVLMVLAVTSALSLAFLQKVSIGISTTKTRSDSIQAQYLAEAAANHAMWRLLNQSTFPAASNVYYMHSLGNGRYGYKVRRHTNTTFATVAVVGGVGDTVVHQSYVIYVKGGWYDSAWKYRQKISISADVADTDLADFPYMVNIADAANGLFMNGQLDGDDIIFTDSESIAKLDHELEKYTSLDGTEELVAWVKLPSLSSSETTEIYMYYGNHPASNQENAVAVWSNDYESVYHLYDNINDSVGNHNGTVEDTDDITGPIAGAQDFVPSDSISIGQWSVSGDKLTIQAWMKADDFNQGDPRVLAKANGTSRDDYVWSMGLRGKRDDQLRFYLKTGTDDGSGTQELKGDNPIGYLANVNSWYLVAMTYDGSLMRIIKNGQDGGTKSVSGNIRENNWDIEIGKTPTDFSTTSRSWDGKIDEVRISKVDRSIDWMMAEYRNQDSPATYQSLEAEESRYLGGTILTEAHFDSDDEGFVFLDDTFRSTSEAFYAYGAYTSSGGYDGGALGIRLGGVDDNVITGMSGGWKQTFTLAADSDVSVYFVYKLIQAANYESDEFSQVLVSVDGTLYGEGGGWWDTDWLNRTNITFDNTNSAENLTDFPVLVSLTAAEVDFDKIKADGADIRFVDNDGTLLNYEIEAWDDVAETAKVWVKVPQINAGSNTDFIYLYYNNTSASDAQNAAGVWDANHVGVWHMNETGTGTRYDATSNNYDGTPQNYDGDEATANGKIDGADEFDAVNDEISIPVGGSYSTFTTSMWIYPTNPDSWATFIGKDWNNAIDMRGSGAGGDAWKWGYYESGMGYANSLLTQNDWNFVTVVRSGSSVTFYLNGNNDGSTWASANMAFDWIGNDASDEAFGGMIDEVRISNIARSADWIEASYLSQNGTFEFCTFSGEGVDDYVAQITGDGNGGSSIATAWHRFHIDLGTLAAGTHTLIIGGYNNKKTFNDESTAILIDDVIVRQ